MPERVIIMSESSRVSLNALNESVWDSFLFRDGGDFLKHPIEVLTRTMLHPIEINHISNLIVILCTMKQ